MQPKMPKTLFSMNLSRSAKETELRIRNIFQWKKKRPPVVLFALVLLMAIVCGSLVGFVPSDATAAKGMTVGLIESRKTVPESYLELLDGETRQMAEAYNEITVELSTYYTEYATNQADFFADANRSSVLEAPFFKHITGTKRPLYYYFIECVSSAALYPNAAQKLVDDPFIGKFIDTGGSYGLWATYIHSDFNTSEEIAALVQEYFELIDALTVRLSEV